MISMWKHDSERLKHVGNVVSCCKLVDWLFSDLKNVLYWWNYGVWKFPGNDFPFITITKNTACDMMSMWIHGSKIIKEVGKFVICYKLVYCLFYTSKSFSIGKVMVIESFEAMIILYFSSPKIQLVMWYQCENMFLKDWNRLAML